MNLVWSFDHDRTRAPLVVTFDVLRGCPFDVVLGKDFLEETEAFTKHSQSFRDVRDGQHAGLNLVIFTNGFSLSIFKSKRKEKKNEPSGSMIYQNSSKHPLLTLKSGLVEEVTLVDKLHQELNRRAKANRDIAKLKNVPSIKSAVSTEEAERRSRWDNRYCGGRYPAQSESVPTSASMSSTSGLPSTRSTSRSNVQEPLPLRRIARHSNLRWSSSEGIDGFL